MKGFLIAFALCVLGVHANPRLRINSMPIRGRVGGGEVATNAPHACMVLVNRPDLEGTNTAALGGGSIISPRHVLSAAHLTRGQDNTFQIGFRVGTIRRMVRSEASITHDFYDPATFENDISIIMLIPGSTFPAANVIPFALEEAAPPSGEACILAGFGFTAPDSTTATTEPMAALQTVDAECTAEAFNATETHFCAADGGTTIVCPGDNGAGLFIAGATPAENSLVGIASRILPGCAEPAQTGYTRVGLFATWLRNMIG